MTRAPETGWVFYLDLDALAGACMGVKGVGEGLLFIGATNEVAGSIHLHEWPLTAPDPGRS